MDFHLFDSSYSGLDPLFSSPNQPNDVEIEEIIDHFVLGDLSRLEAEAALERLTRAKQRILPRLLAMAASPDPDLHQVATLLLQETGLTQAIEPLRELLDDSSLDDDHKMNLLHALQRLGGMPNGEDPFVYLRDPEAMIQKSHDAFLDFLQDPPQLEMLLRATLEDDLPTLASPELLTTMAYTQDRRLRILFLCLLHAPSDDVVLAAVEALKILEDPSAIDILKERVRHDPSSRVRKAAKQAVKSLSNEAFTRMPSVLDLPVVPPPLIQCMISTIDGNGGQVLLVVRQSTGHPPCFWDVMFNDHEGIKDSFGGYGDSIVEIEDMVVEGMSEIGVEMVEIGLERARSEIRSAYDTTLAARRRLPPGFLNWRIWLHGDDAGHPTFPLPRIDDGDLSALLDKSDELLDLDEFASWYFNLNELQGMERRFVRLVHRSGTEDAIQALIGQAVEKIVDSSWRQLLSDRLERQAWLLAQVYEDAEIPRLALAAARSLDADSPIASVDNPFLRGMMLHSLSNSAGLIF